MKALMKAFNIIYLFIYFAFELYTFTMSDVHSGIFRSITPVESVVDNSLGVLAICRDRIKADLMLLVHLPFGLIWVHA